MPQTPGDEGKSTKDFEKDSAPSCSQEARGRMCMYVCRSVCVCVCVCVCGCGGRGQRGLTTFFSSTRGIKSKVFIFNYNHFLHQGTDHDAVLTVRLE